MKAHRKGTKLAIIYCRISLDKKGKLDPAIAQEGVERQEKDCRAWCRRNGYKIVGQPLIDNDRPASKGGKREGWDALVELLDSKAASTVVSYNLDRVTRFPPEMEYLIHNAEHRGVSIQQTEGGLMDLSSPTGAFQARVLCAAAKLESDNTARRVKTWHRHQAENGLWTGKTPYGYEKTADKSLKIVPAEAKIVREIANRLLAGEKRHIIIADLNARGVLRRGDTWTYDNLDSAIGLRWNYNRHERSTERVASPTVAGYIFREDEDGEMVEHPGKWKPILDLEVWRLLATKATQRSTRGEHVKRFALLTGAVQCTCGGTMRRHANNGPMDPTTGERTRNVTYRCAKPTIGHAGYDGCGKCWINAEALEEFAVAAYLDQLNGRKVKVSAEDEGTVIRARLAEIEAKLNMYADTFEDDKDQFQRKAAPLKAERLELQGELSRQYKGAARLDTHGADPTKVWEQLEPEQQHAFLKAELRIIVTPQTGRLRTGEFDADRCQIVWAG